MIPIFVQMTSFFLNVVIIHSKREQEICKSTSRKDKKQLLYVHDDSKDK